MLDHPEYDLDTTRNILSVIDKKERIAELIEENQDIEFTVRIGKDEALDKCAIVTAKYKINGKEIGQAGVIGPERMDYSKVISIMKYINKKLNDDLDIK